MFALLHDIGMVVSEDEIIKIKNDDLNIVDKKYSLVYKKYDNENISLQECISPIHGIRAKSRVGGCNMTYSYLHKKAEI